MRRVVGLIEQVEGVRSVDNLVVISQSAKTRDRTLAARLSRLMRGQFPRARVDASVFGGIAVLRGKVRGAAERQAIELLVADQPGVVRVVSKVS
jgi:osmotically-inducible protein OsmY